MYQTPHVRGASPQFTLILTVIIVRFPKSLWRGAVAPGCPFEGSPAVYTLYKLKVHVAECQTLSLWVISYCAPTVYPLCVCAHVHACVCAHVHACVCVA